MGWRKAAGGTSGVNPCCSEPSFPVFVIRIAVTQERFGPFERGAFYAVHDDGNTVAFDWAGIAEALDLRTKCSAP